MDLKFLRGESTYCRGLCALLERGMSEGPEGLLGVNERGKGLEEETLPAGMIK
jgi:hypothetical protein